MKKRSKTRYQEFYFYTGHSISSLRNVSKQDIKGPYEWGIV